MKNRMAWFGVFMVLGAQQVWAQSNLLGNAGFETPGSNAENAYHWEWGNPDQDGAKWGSAARADWRAFSGSWLGAIRGTWAGAGSDGGWWQQTAATPGQRYRFTAWFWADGEGAKWSPTDQGMKIEFFTASDQLIVEHVQRFSDVGPHWIRKTMEATAPTNAAVVRVVIFADDVGVNGALQFDDLALVEVEEPAGIRPGPSSRRTGVVISEIMYHPSDRLDGKDIEFVELHNTTPFTYRLAGHRLSGSIAYAFDADVELEPFGFLVVAKEPASVETVYGISDVLGPYEERLPNSSGWVRLRKSQAKNPQRDAVLLEVNYSDQPPWPLAADGGGHSLVLARASYGEDDPRAWSASAALGGSPGEPEPPVESMYTNVVINEFMAHTDPPDDDFIELFNTSSQAIDLSGCTLSDTMSTNKFVIPDGTTIPGHGMVVFYEDPDQIGAPPPGSTNFHFGLSSAGEDVVFRTPDGTVVDAYRFEAQENGVAMGRYPDGANSFHVLIEPTPGTSNAAWWIRSVVINEIMFNPISRDDNDQYIELHNWSGSSVDISHWRFVDGITFTFPAGTSIAAGGYLVLAGNAVHLMSNYPGVLNSANTIGDFEGTLSGSGERIALAKPDNTNLPDQDFVIVDEVSYVDGGRWGEWANGGGSSLELIDPRSDNRLAPNWANSDESAKSDWAIIEHTGALDHGLLPDGADIDQLHLVMLRRGQVLVDNVEVRRVVSEIEQGNRVANSTFEAGLGDWAIEGNVVQSGLADEGFESSLSLHVRATGGGDTGANRIKTDLTSPFSDGQTVVLRARARWLRGGPHLLLRLRGNYLEAESTLPVPKNLGTPGQSNSRYAANAGPAIWDVTHLPVLPAADEPVTVTARVHDPDGLDAMALHYRLDPSATTNTVAMTHSGGGTYSGTIPGQPSGQLVAFHIQAWDDHAAPAVSRYPDDVPPGSRPGPGREALVRFGEADAHSELGSYRFWMTQANLDEWKTRKPHSDEYLDMTFVADAKRVIHNASMRFRGSPWVRPGLPNPDEYEGLRSAYRVKIPPDDPFLGMDELNLDTLEQYKDDTLQRERMVFQIGADLGLSSSYQRYVFIRFNGIQYPYAYADVHHVERDYFRTWFPEDDDGDLFKVDDWAEYASFNIGEFDVAGATLESFVSGDELKKARYRWNWEKQANAGFDPDYSGLFRLVESANLTNNQYTATLEAVADMRQWMKVFAHRHVIGDWDGFGYHRGKNAFIYRPNGGRWNIVPWDMDFALGTAGSHNWDHDLFDVENMPVIAGMFAHPPFRRYYWQALYDAAHGALQSANVDPVLDEVYDALIEQGVAAADPTSTADWISNRRGYILAQLNPVTNLNLAVTSNNGFDFNTNANEIALTGQAPIHMRTIRFNGVEYPLTWTTETDWLATLALNAGPNPIAVTGYDADGNLMATTYITVTYTGTDVEPEGMLVINEIMYHPADGLAEFLELYNTSTNYAFDLTGHRLAGVSYIFEEGAVIPPLGFVVLVENVPHFAAVHTNLNAVIGEYTGKLDNSGEQLRLLRPDGLGGELLVDQVVYDRLAPWPGEADGQGPSLQLIDARRDRDRVANWAADTEILYTPGASNSVTRALPEFPRVWINELQSVNASGVADHFGERDPWLELYNEEGTDRALTNFYLTEDYDNLGQWSFPPGAFAPAEEFRLVWMDGETHQTDGTNYHASFLLNTASGSVALVHSNAGEVLIVDYVNYPEVPEDEAYGSFPNGDPHGRSLFQIPTPGAPNTPLTPVTLNALILPRYIQGEQDAGGDNVNRVPYAFRARVEGLLPNETYRYANRVVTADDPWDQDGAGNMIFVKTNGADFVRTTSGPRFRPGDLYTRHGAFVTDGSGTFEGWFVTEPSGNARFTPGNTLNMRVLLNDGMGGEEIEHFLTTTGGVSVVSLGTSATNASAFVGYSHAGPRQFVVLYDDEAAVGRPVAAAFVEATGAETDSRYADFYTNEVSGQAGRWGTILPNEFPEGLRRLEERGLNGGAVQNVVYEEDAGWPGTVNPNGGLTPTQLNAPPLLQPVQNVDMGPGSLVVLSLSADDPDAPPQSLTFNLISGPPGAQVETTGPGAGEFRWRPGDERALTTNVISIKVNDDGNPSLTESEMFTIRVLGFADQLTVEGESNGSQTNFVLGWPSEAGRTYRVQYTPVLTGGVWTVLGSDVEATGSWSSSEDGGIGDVTQRMYRVLRLLD